MKRQQKRLFVLTVISILALPLAVGASGIFKTTKKSYMGLVAGKKTYIGQSQTVTLGTGLVGYWTFNGKETNWATGKVNDITANANNGSLVGASTTTSPIAGRIGQALTFSTTTIPAVTNLINIPSSTNYDSTTGTWAFWFKTTATTVNTVIMSRADSGSNSSCNGMTILFNNTAGTISPYIKSPGGCGAGTALAPLASSQTNLNNGKWHHFAFTFNGTKTAILYVDGIRSNSGTPTTWSFNSQPVRLAMPTDTFWANYAGSLDDVRIYNRVLSATEVWQLYYMGK